MERRITRAKGSDTRPDRIATEPSAPLRQLWSAIKTERRALAERTSMGTARFGWLDEARS